MNERNESVALLDVEELRARAFMNPVPHDGILMRLAAEEIARLGKAISDVTRDRDAAERDALRLRWLAETMKLAQDDWGACNWNGTLLDIVLKRFKEWRREPGADALDAMRKAIDTQVVHADVTTPSSLPTTER